MQTNVRARFTLPFQTHAAHTEHTNNAIKVIIVCSHCSLSCMGDKDSTIYQCNDFELPNANRIGCFLTSSLYLPFLSPTPLCALHTYFRSSIRYIVHYTNTHIYTQFIPSPPVYAYIPQAHNKNNVLIAHIERPPRRRAAPQIHTVLST